MLTGKYRRGATGRSEALGGRVFQPENSPQRTAILDTVIAVAEETGATPGQVAIAWVASKGPLPIIGPRTLEQLGDNLGATRLKLTPEQLARLDEASAIPPVFPRRGSSSVNTGTRDWRQARSARPPSAWSPRGCR